jgi:phosphoribosylaminoimidazolecarboxamide formyltransferase/IMP cyclohydrolase
MKGHTMSKIDKTTRAQYRTRVEEDYPEEINLGEIRFQKKLSMRYGENPGYPAAFYREASAVGPNMANLEVLQQGSKGLGYINVGDMDLGQRLARKLTLIYPQQKVCVLVKHEMPSGVAMGHDALKVFLSAWGCDPLSNFGSVDVFNYTVSEELASAIVEKGRNVEVVYAPEFTPGALEVLAGRKPLRVVRMAAWLDTASQDEDIEIKRVAGGLLVQKRFDSRVTSPEAVEVVSLRPATPAELEAAIFNWTVATFTRSNAIVIGTRHRVHGIGSGQRSRIDAAEDAIRLSRRGYGPDGCVMASDAFMPFPDVVELAAASGITAIIYPLGAMRDEEIIARADELKLAMIATRRPGESASERCFLHR